MSSSPEPGSPNPMPASGRRYPLPGVAAICLYLLLVAGIVIVGVVGGQHYPPIFLLFAALFITSSAGLIASFRWAWALSLAAVFLLMSYNFWVFSLQHEIPAAVQGLLNLVFFLYLIRPEIRVRLR